MKNLRLFAASVAALLVLGVLVPALSAATCSGGANCRACTTCSSCKHCAKQGGTCSVCAGGKKGKEAKATEEKSVACCDSAEQKPAGQKPKKS